MFGGKMRMFSRVHTMAGGNQPARAKQVEEQKYQRSFALFNMRNQSSQAATSPIYVVLDNDDEKSRFCEVIKRIA